MATRPGDPDIEQPPLLGQFGRLAGLADRQGAFLERRQEDGIPLQALGPVVGEQLHAGRRATGLDGGPSLHLGDERLGIGRGLRPDQVVRQLE